MESQKKLDVQEKPTVCDKRDPEKVDLEKIDLEAPPDRFYIIYILFFFLGLVHFLPWSFFTTATEYWMFKFRNTTINETDSEFRTDLQASFSASLKVTLQVSDIVFLTLSMMFGRFIRVRVRMIGVLTVILTLFVIVTIFTKIDTDSWQEGFFVMVMGIISGINAMNAIFTITMYTIIANFPHHYLAPYLTGGGLSKIFTSILQIISLTLGLGTTNSALVYFCMGVFVIVFTLTAFIATGRNKFYLYHMRNFQEGQKEKMITFKEGFRLLKKIWSSVVMMGLFLLSVDASPTALVVSEDEGSGPWSEN
ncbi:Nucleoside tran domain containing protein [Asbolus verrucosus]|uniref:Nucleoside tran domain containing protein n=1 Tax=Asbolus verrucosus TaxID=1661398 RepID=A0A482VFD3_ASBVE|nr:Nucleoside tran domain containing protein [Asbolus verrucosus]